MKLLSVQGAALRLAVGTATVRRWCDEGALPAHGIVEDTNQRVFTPEAVERRKAELALERRERGHRG